MSEHIDYEAIPSSTLLLIVAVMVILTIIAGTTTCRVNRGLHDVPQRYELKEGAPEDPQWEIVEYEGGAKLLDPNGAVVGVIERSLGKSEN